MKTLLTTTMTLMLAASSVHAETVCRDYKKNGDVKIVKLCADSFGKSSFKNLRMVTKHGEWHIGPGINPLSRASRLCKILQAAPALSNATFKTRIGSSKQSTVNLQGDYAYRFRNFDFEYISQVTCR